MNQTQSEFVGKLAATPVARKFALTLRRNRVLRLLLTCYLTLLLAGSSAITAEEAGWRRLALTVAGYEFDLLPWMVNAWKMKLAASVTQPADDLTQATATTLVRQYLNNVQKIRELEEKINGLLSTRAAQAATETAAYQAEIARLRQEQSERRATVEQVIERQVASVLSEEGLAIAGTPLPPVKFAFVEPPRKLVVSPRQRIETIYAQMLEASMSLDQVQAIEERVHQEHNLSAYITGIGGLGAYPTMVIDSASLPWVLSTVAHEWTHNYLTFFPLGFTYGATSDNIIINETVAELVGNELGDRVLRTYYPDLAPPSAGTMPSEEEMSEPPAFDFGAEMRETRLMVDQLLALGKVEDAERYMEARRLYFVENGYNLRVLNQAYFAFHGSYGTGPASSSPLGPKLERLRQLTPDVKTFLAAVRSITTAAEVDQALADWEAQRQD